jgi:hypothetical protein
MTGLAMPLLCNGVAASVAYNCVTHPGQRACARRLPMSATFT